MVVKPDNIMELVETGSKLMFDIHISPKSWVLPNRVKFTNWIDETFKYDALSFSNTALKTQRTKLAQKAKDSQQDACGSKSDSIELFSHQKFIKDYIQFDSPYRGVLVYHGLGVGKTCSAVAAAEILLKNMNVTVMLPASLKPNFIDEIKKCGSVFYKLKQNWIFINRKDIQGLEKEVYQHIPIDISLINKNEGLWVPSSKSQSNYNSLSEKAQLQIKEQVDSLIKNRFNFVSYNGLRRSHLEEWTKGGRNPFDNQCVIVDEVHNLVSKIVNGRQIGQAIYKLLMTAKNCKLILLSGTPIINYPFEIAYVINLLMGPRITYDIKATKTSAFNIEEISRVLSESPYVDYFTFDENAKSISLVMVPEGYKITDKKNNLISKDLKQLTKLEMYNVIASDLKRIHIEIMKKTTKDEKAMPEEQEEFNKYFINFATNLVNNPKLFMKRILGAVSFYSTYSPELYPSVSKNDVAIEMNEFQFPIYEEARSKEIKKESQSKNKSDGGDNPFASSGQVYRFYSRAICNFVFPEEIKRPFPSKSSFTKSELDVAEDDEDIFLKEGTSTKKSAKAAERDEYLAALNKALHDLSLNMHSPDSYLNENNIGKYSPKFKAIYDKIKKNTGNTLVYSQFRKVEGLGILGLILQANGYAEFKVKKLQNGDWDLDIPEQDYNKPKYTMFTGNNEESKMLLKIFNSDFETLPENIKSKLPLVMVGNPKEEVNNLHGGLIKVIMITQSGAEGISLKNVRQVHIVEPYWNQVRMDQVIGRAVRTCSHVELPSSERHVDVYTYYTIFPSELVAKSFTLKTKDKSLTTDEYIYRIAKRKANIINSILDLLKKAAVDCGINAKKHR